MKKKLLFIIGGLLLLFIITNPSLKDFKEHLGHVNYAYISRQNNFFVCSVYNDEDDTAKYIAILGNFHKINGGNKPNETSENINTNAFIYSISGNAKESLYSHLISAGYTVSVLGEKNDFYKNISDQRKAIKLYDALIKSGYTEKQIGTREQFIYYLSEK